MKTKTTAIIFLLFSINIGFSQKYDARLEKNHGDTISVIFSKSHNYYNFLLFELDNAYELKSKSELTEKSGILKASSFKNSKGKALSKQDVVKGTFNFKEWGIVLKQDAPVIIELDDQTVLYFYDKVSNNIRFAKSPLYTK